MTEIQNSLIEKLFNMKESTLKKISGEKGGLKESHIRAL